MQEHPLSGKTFIVTRPKEQADSLCEQLQGLGAHVLCCPVIEIVPPDDEHPLRDALAELSSFDWVIVTSVNGVNAVVEMAELLGFRDDTKSWPQNWPRFAAIGPATAETLNQNGITVSLVPDSFIAESIFDCLHECEGSLQGKRILLPRAKAARRNLSDQLREAGADVMDIVAYQTVAVSELSEQCLDVLDGSDIIHVVFTSSSTVHAFFSLLNHHGRSMNNERFRAVSIGPITTQTLLEKGIRPFLEAAEYSVPGIIAALQRTFSGNHGEV